MLNYILTVFIVSLGILSGVILGKIAKEELKPGTRNLVLLQGSVLFLLIALFLYFDNAYLALISAVVVVGRIITGKITKPTKNHFYYAVYAVFALLFFASFGKPSFIGTASLIFIFGLPTGSLLYMKKEWLKNSISISLVFFILSVLIGLIF